MRFWKTGNSFLKFLNNSTQQRPFAYLSVPPSLKKGQKWVEKRQKQNSKKFKFPNSSRFSKRGKNAKKDQTWNLTTSDLDFWNLFFNFLQNT